MSIAELIMKGTESTSESNAWAGDMLSKIGQNVSKNLREKAQREQAQEMLPLLQQNLKTAMTQAQSGKSGDAYSTLLGSIDTQMLNNPQLVPFIKLGFDAVGKSTDDYISSQKTAGTSLVDAFILNQLSGGKFPIPSGGGGVGGGAGGQDLGTPDVPAQIVKGVELIQAPGMEDIDTTQGISAVRNNQFSVPVQGKDNKTYYAQPRMDALLVGGGTELIDNPAPWTPTKGNAQQQPTPAQEEARAFYQENQKVAETQGTGKAWYNEAVDPKSPKLKELSQTHDPLDFAGAEKYNVGTIYFPKEQNLDKEFKITAKGDMFNVSMDRNKVDTELEKQRRSLKINITRAIAKMESKEMKDLFDDYGSVENFPLPSSSNPKVIKFPRKEKDGKVKMVSLPITGVPDQDGVIKNM